MPDRQRPQIGVTPSEEDDRPEPFEAAEVRHRLRQHLTNNSFYPSKHAKERMRECDMTLLDALNVLRGGVLDHPRWLTFEGGSWRYRFETSTMVSVIAFDRERDQVVLVTAFRLGG